MQTPVAWRSLAPFWSPTPSLCGAPDAPSSCRTCTKKCASSSRPLDVPGRYSSRGEEEFASRREGACIESLTCFIGFLPGVHAHGSEVDAEEGLEARADVVVERTAAAPHLVDRFLDGGGHLGPIGRVIRR